MKHLLAIDQGTTSSRAIIYDEYCHPLFTSQKEFSQSFPKPGWVEHDATEIWESVLETSREAIEKAKASGPLDIAAIGITNQRETLVLWDRKTGDPVAPAIVWQDRRTGEYMSNLRESGKEPFIQQKAGLLLDPYFSASKLHWLLRQVPKARFRAEAGELAVGTIDSWLIYKLTGGKAHVTDVTNASRTMLMNLRSGEWDPDLLALFAIPAAVLPRILPTSGHFGDTDPELLGKSYPICSAIGDQQAALFGQLCTTPGLIKCTYGTGCFMLSFTGSDPMASSNRLLSTVAWKIGDQPLQYALEGSVFTGGSAVQWLRDNLKIIETAADINPLAAQVIDADGLVVVPAFTGLGAPHWDPTARGAIFGISRGTTTAHIAYATLESIAFQVTDLLTAMEKDSGHRVTTLRVDGGASASDLLMQMQADLLGTKVERPGNLETTALGAAMMAGLGIGLWKNQEELTDIRAVDRLFRPALAVKERRTKLKLWHKAVKRSKNWATE